MDVTGKQSIPIELTQLVSIGGLSKVYRAIRTDTGQTVAVKRIHLDINQDARKRQIDLLEAKLKICKQLKHLNVVDIIHYQLVTGGHDLDPPEYQILMKFCEGKTLHDQLRSCAVTPQLLQNWTRQIVDGLAYLHDQRCIHGDIKGANILLSSTDVHNCQLNICGLENVQQLLKERTMPKEAEHERGTWAFMSPEMITGGERDSDSDQPERKTFVGRRTDIWSLGCVVLEMLTGSLPEFYKDRDGGRVRITGDMAVMYFIGTGGLPTIPSGLPGPVEDMLRKCLQRNPADRPWAHDLKNHHMLTSDEAEISNWQLPSRAPPV